MRVIRAEAMGWCFGVRDALTLVRSLPDPQQVAIHGELVHNERVLLELGRRGFQQSPESQRGDIPAKPRIVITAHGISERERTRLTEAGKTLIDATCPLVRRVHQAAQNFQNRGYFVLVLGQPGHAEVEGIVGDLYDYAVVPNEEAVRKYRHSRLGIVCQSTTPPNLAEQVREAIERCNPQAEIEFADTICRPTRERQEAVLALLDQVEALVVVGGKHSNNTRRLAGLAEERGIPVTHVQGAADLDADWLSSFEVVGLTAGTSTPDEVIEEVQRRLESLRTAIPVPG